VGSWESSVNPLDRVLRKLTVARGPDERGEYLDFCPAHDDRKTPNLRVGVTEDSRVLLHRFAGCRQERVLAALEERGIRSADLFANRDGGAAVRRSCKLEDYAIASRLPVSLLEDFGLSEISYAGVPNVRIPYFGRDGQEKAVRFRPALTQGPERDGRFRWKSGSKILPYGLWRLDRGPQGRLLLAVNEIIYACEKPTIRVFLSRTQREEQARGLRHLIGQGKRQASPAPRRPLRLLDWQQRPTFDGTRLFCFPPPDPRWSQGRRNRRLQDPRRLQEGRPGAPGPRGLARRRARPRSARGSPRQGGGRGGLAARPLPLLHGRD
jgi:hypothetical protein